MEKLILKSIEVMAIGSNIPEDFDKQVYVFVGEENTRDYALFKLYILSCKRLEKYEEHSDEAGMYLRFTLIMKYYDENIVKKHIQQILAQCNQNPTEKRFNCLSLYLRSEIEEDVYY